jgi:hypothetical protein
VGNFYVTFTAKGEIQQEIARTLKDLGRRAYILPPENGYTVFTDADADAQSPGDIEAVGHAVSAKVGAPVLGVLNHDDDILQYWLFIGGRTESFYDSCPGYFDGGDPTPTGGDPAGLATFAGKSGVESSLNDVLKQDYVFAFERHMELLRLLGLPQSALGYGYNTFEAGEFPEGVPRESIVQTG